MGKKREVRLFSQRNNSDGQFVALILRVANVVTKETCQRGVSVAIMSIMYSYFNCDLG